MVINVFVMIRVLCKSIEISNEDCDYRFWIDLKHHDYFHSVYSVYILYVIWTAMSEKLTVCHCHILPMNHVLFNMLLVMYCQNGKHSCSPWIPQSSGHLGSRLRAAKFHTHNLLMSRSQPLESHPMLACTEAWSQWHHSHHQQHGKSASGTNWYNTNK